MKREQEIRQKAISQQRCLMESCDWRAGFIAGAKWADKAMINKVCAYLYAKSKMSGSEINSFKKAMEE